MASLFTDQKTESMPCFRKVSTFIHPFIHSQNPVTEGERIDQKTQCPYCMEKAGTGEWEGPVFTPH